jgi:glycosyltransferase involved in cell wall biosynthesis
MKIEFTLHDEASSDAGGMGVTSGLSAAYRELGHEVGLLCFADLPARLPFMAKTLVFPGLVAARLRNAPVDVIDAATGDGWILGRLRRLKRSQAPLLVCRSHGMSYIADKVNREEARRGNLELSWKYPLYWGGLRPRLDTAAQRSADLCLFLNQEELRVGVEELGVDPEKARIISNGLPAELIGLPLAPLDSLAAEAPRIAHIGSYLRPKGIVYLVEALQAVLSSHPGARATLLGTGAPADAVKSDFPPELRERVDVIPSYPRHELPELLRGHAVVVSPSLREGFPLGVLEAMACGLAPAVSNIPGPTEYVSDGENGLAVPVADGPALAAAIERLLGDRELLGRFRAAAHATAQDYGWDRVGARTLALYEEAIDRVRR